MAGSVASREFANDLRSPGAARRWVSDLTAAAVPDGNLHDDLMLLVSELVTNAVRYTSDAVTVLVYRHDCAIWVAVSDGVAGRVQPKHAEPEDTSGRGLQLVDTTSSAWGVVAEREGKAVWFELAPAGHQVARTVLSPQLEAIRAASPDKAEALRREWPELAAYLEFEPAPDGL